MFGFLHSMQNCAMFNNMKKNLKNGVREFFQELLPQVTQQKRSDEIINQEAQPTELDELKGFAMLLFAGCLVQEMFDQKDAPRQPIPRNISSLEEERLEKEQKSFQDSEASKQPQQRVTFATSSSSVLNQEEEELFQKISSSTFKPLPHDESETSRNSSPWVLIDQEKK